MATYRPWESDSKSPSGPAHAPSPASARLDFALRRHTMTHGSPETTPQFYPHSIAHPGMILKSYASESRTPCPNCCRPVNQHVMHAWSSCLSHRSSAIARSHSAHATASDSTAHGTSHEFPLERLRFQLTPTRGEALRAGRALLPRLGRCAPCRCSQGGEEARPPPFVRPCAAAARLRQAGAAGKRSPGSFCTRKQRTHTFRTPHIIRRRERGASERTRCRRSEDRSSPCRKRQARRLSPPFGSARPGLKATNRGRRLLARRLAADASTTKKR